jgi:TPR repeat protein
MQKVLFKYDSNKKSSLRWEIIETNTYQGKPLDKGTLKNGNGTIINYDKNNKPTSIITYVEGRAFKEETALVKDIDKIYENILPKDDNNKIIAKGTSAERAVGEYSYEMSKGLYYYSTGEYTSAFGFFRAAAEKGDQEAMVYIGKMYYEGKGTTKDYKKAYDWILKATYKGNAKAAYQLADMYYYGNGVPQSYAEAYKWYNVAAAKGEADADYNIGLLFEAGEGVEKSKQTAFNHFKKAADNGSLHGAYATGIYYYYGSAGEKNIPLALKYTLMAEKAFEKSPDYYNQLAYCYFSSGNKKMAYGILSNLVKNHPDYANGFDSLGEICLSLGMNEQAKENYKKAAQMGHQNAIKWCKNNNVTY